MSMTTLASAAPAACLACGTAPCALEASLAPVYAARDAWEAVSCQPLTEAAEAVLLGYYQVLSDWMRSNVGIAIQRSHLSRHDELCHEWSRIHSLLGRPG